MHIPMPLFIIKVKRKIIKNNKEQNKQVNKFLNQQKKMLSKKYKKRKIKYQLKICHKEKYSGLKNLIGLLVHKDT